VQISKLIKGQAPDGVLHQSGQAHLNAMSMWENTVDLGRFSSNNTIALSQIGHRSNLSHLSSTSDFILSVEQAVLRTSLEDFTIAIQRDTEIQK
jgi:hypothetical protein